VDPTISLRSLDIAFKLNGYAAEQINTQVNYNTLILETQDIDKEIARLEKELKGLSEGKSSEED
jgi:hypothetical protein